jgi:hypothetical protein
MLTNIMFIIVFGNLRNRSIEMLNINNLYNDENVEIWFKAKLVFLVQYGYLICFLFTIRIIYQFIFTCDIMRNVSEIFYVSNL